MKKLLIIGASILQLPAIKRAKEMGLEVAVADYNPNAIGIQYADYYYNASTIDQNAITQVAEEYRPDGIMTLATDMPMRSVAASTSALKLPGISMDTAMKATDKGEMIKAFKAHNVESPWYYIINDKKDLIKIKHLLSYPCIVKPTDNAGSRGVMIIEDECELEKAFDYSSNEGRSGSVIIEEYMTGNEVSVEIIVYKGNVHILSITDKLTTGAPHFVELGHNQPSLLPTSDQEKIKDLASRAVKSIGLTDGPAHVEIMLTNDGPKMIELGARMGGDCITTHLVPLSTGIDMIKATIEICLGNEPNLIKKFQKGSAIRFFTPPKGIVKEINGLPEALNSDGIIDIEIPITPGSVISDIKSSLDRSGYVIAQGENAMDAINKCNVATGLIEIVTENESKR